MAGGSVMISVGPGDPNMPDRVHRAWHGLRSELARLSANSRHHVSQSPSHYLNFGEPDLVAAAVSDVVRCARSGARLADAERAVSDAE